MCLKRADKRGARTRPASSGRQSGEVQRQCEARQQHLQHPQHTTTRTVGRTNSLPTTGPHSTHISARQRCLIGLCQTRHMVSPGVQQCVGRVAVWVRSAPRTAAARWRSAPHHPQQTHSAWHAALRAPSPLPASATVCCNSSAQAQAATCCSMWRIVDSGARAAQPPALDWRPRRRVGPSAAAIGAAMAGCSSWHGDGQAHTPPCVAGRCHPP